MLLPISLRQIVRMSSVKSDEVENGFTFIWKIKNFSLCSQNDEYLPSPSFQVEMFQKTKWQLRLYTDIYKNNIVLILSRLESDEGPNEKINVNVKLFLTNREDFKITHIQFERKYGIDYYLGEPLKITRSSIFEDTDLFIPDDTLTVGCHLSNISEEMCHKYVCTASTEIVAERFFFSTPVAFPPSNTQSKQIVTIPFNSNSKNFIFKMESESPLGSLNSKENIISRLVMSGFSDEIIAVCKLELQDTNGVVKYSFKGENKFVAGENNQVWLLPRLETSNRDKVRGSSNVNAFILHLKLSVSDGKTHSLLENVYCPSVLEVDEKKPVSKHPAEQKLRGLLADKKFCDFVFHIDGKELPVHKALLSAASPVFYAMFDHDMKEKTSSESIIEDIEADTMERLIEFIYTDDVEDLNFDKALKLYSAADKYQISQLKRCCAEFIISDFSIDNLTEVLSIADMYQDEFLKKAADSFLFVNSKEVFRSDKWKVFMEINLKVAAKSMHEICLRMTEHILKSCV